MNPEGKLAIIHELTLLAQEHEQPSVEYLCGILDSIGQISEMDWYGRFEEK